jgi:hypothetical protein
MKGGFKDQAEIINDPEVFPNLMGDELASQVPPTIIYSTEFDDHRQDAEEAA